MPFPCFGSVNGRLCATFTMDLEEREGEQLTCKIHMAYEL